MRWGGSRRINFGENDKSAKNYLDDILRKFLTITPNGGEHKPYKPTEHMR